MTHPILKLILNQLHDANPDILASAVVSIDGIAMEWILRKDTNPDRVGGMSAALVSLGAQAAKELACGRLKQVVIEGDDGFTVMVQVGDDAALLVTARSQAKLGLILLNVRETVQAIKHANIF